MRLITLSLFAFLLAVSAFGQEQDVVDREAARTVWVRSWIHGDQGVQSRDCSGVALTSKWVLTAASCIGANPLNNAVVESNLALKSLTYPGRDLRADRTADNLALIHLACPLEGPRAVGGARIRDETPSEPSFAAEVIPVRQVSRVRNAWGRYEWQSMTPRINGNAFEGETTESGVSQVVWTFSSSDEPLFDANDEYQAGLARGAPLYFGQPLSVNRQLIGIYSGDINGMHTFVDITTKWEWLTRTMLNETVHLPELCRSRE